MASMTQEELDRRLAELGGSALVHASVASKKRVPNPNYNAVQVAAGRSNEPEFLEVDVQQWTSPSGHKLQAMRNPDGTWEIVQDEPPAPRAAAPGTTTRGPQQQAEAEAQAAEDKREREWNQNRRDEGGSGLYETHADRRKREAAEAQAAAIAARTNQPQVTIREIKQPDGSTRTEEVVVHPGGRVEVRPSAVSGQPAPRPKDSEIIEVEGRQHEVIRNPATGQITGLRPLTTTSSGPPSPQIILGQSTAALREYADQLNAEVAAGRMTPTERTRRWNEAVQQANHAINEYTVTQREAESRRQTDSALMQNRTNAATTGFGSALGAIEAGNKYLPEGSTLGGKAFMALLGVQQYHAQQMGGSASPYGSLNPDATRSADGRAIAAATGAVTGTTAQQVARLTGPPAAPTPPAVPPPPVPGAAGAAPPPLPAAPVPPRPPAAPPASGPATWPANTDPDTGRPGVGQQQAPPSAANPYQPTNVITATNRRTGERTTITRAQWEQLSPQQQEIFAVENEEAAPVTMAPGGGDGLLMKAGFNQPSDALPPEGVSLQWQEMGDTPTGGPPHWPQPAAAPSPADDFAVLAGARPMAAPQPPPAPDMAGPEPPAVLHARVKATPPWQMTEADLQAFVASGGNEDDFWRSPRRQPVGVA